MRRSNPTLGVIIDQSLDLTDHVNKMCVSCQYHLRNTAKIRKYLSEDNTAARIVTLSKRFDHITLILFKLHWLPLGYRIHFKILLLVYKCLNGLAPTYLSELLRYTNGPRLLRSSSQNFLALPKTRLKTYGDSAFPQLLLGYGINCPLNSGVLHLSTSSGRS